MGRRKIEIQPITHERNRSVTFLKRKNGLFKKAYELGVLCSVDVAVIIFEERPGHHVKLYQYGSADIHDIVQRHIRHDGEKDTRGPADFSGTANSKMDDMGDGDDDDVDDEEDMPSRNNKRTHTGKLKPPPDMVTGIDYTSNHRSLQPPPLSIHGLGPQSGGGPTLPISGIRDNKRSRLGIHPHSRSPSDDPTNGGPYYHSTQNSAGPFGNSRQAGYHPPSQHHGGHGHSNQPYQPFFPQQASPPPSFMPLQSGPAPSSRGGHGYGMPHRSGSSSSGSYDPGMYPNMMGRAGGPPMQGSGPGGGGGGGGDLFATFLDADEQSRHQNQAQQQGFGLDWPVHGGPGSGAQSTSSSSVSNPSGGSSAAGDGGGQNSSGNWLDFLSGNPNASAASNGREAMSWERGGNPNSGANADIFGDRGRQGSGGSPMVIGMNKRSPIGTLLGSPLGVPNGRDDGKIGKDLLKDVGAG